MTPSSTQCRTEDADVPRVPIFLCVRAPAVAASEGELHDPTGQTCPIPQNLLIESEHMSTGNIYLRLHAEISWHLLKLFLICASNMLDAKACVQGVL